MRGRKLLVQAKAVMLPAFVVDDSIVIPVDKNSNEETLKAIYKKLGNLTEVNYSKRRQAYKVDGKLIRETFNVNDIDENGCWFVFMRDDLIINASMAGLIKKKQVLFTFRDFLGL